MSSGAALRRGTILLALHDEGVVLSFGGGASVPLSATCESARLWTLPACVAEVSTVVGVVVGAGASVARSAGGGSWRGSALRLCGVVPFLGLDAESSWVTSCDSNESGRVTAGEPARP